MSYSRAGHIFSNTDEWRALVEADRREIYKHTMVELRRKREDEAQTRVKNLQSVFADLLDSLTNIEYRTTWAEAQKILAEREELKESAELQDLHKLDQLVVFKDHIKKLEEQVRHNQQIFFTLRVCFSMILIVRTKTEPNIGLSAKSETVITICLTTTILEAS